MEMVHSSAADPDDVYALISRGAAFLESGDHDRAEQDLDEAIRIEPTVAEAHRNRGAVHLKRRDYGRAVEDLDTAIRLDPSNAASFVNRGSALVGRGKLEQAEGSSAAAFWMMTVSDIWPLTDASAESDHHSICACTDSREQKEHLQ